jgi:hypothetical protein
LSQFLNHSSLIIGKILRLTSKTSICFWSPSYLRE